MSCSLLGSCASTPKEKEQLQSERTVRDLADEREIGRLMAAKLAGTFGVYDSSPELLHYVNLVGQAVVLQSNRPEVTYHFGILKGDEVNAFATPGGYIFVTVGLLKALKSESELAGILGHEIAHVTQKHMYSVIMPTREASVGETLSLALSRGGSAIGMSAGKIVNAGMQLLLEKGLGPEKEQEADSTGVLFASATGYDARALNDFLVRLSNSAGSVKVSKTHPPFPARLKSLSAFMAKNGFTKSHTQFDLAVLDSRFQDATRGLTPAP